jgi:iron complex transport system substrate-binding protein
MRIVSLLPSATEIVCALGLRDSLVGRSHECDWPGDVTSLPEVSMARIDSAALASQSIDRAVARAIESGEELYGIDEAVLDALDPDLIVTQSLCTVCAVSGGTVRALTGRNGRTPAILELEPAGIDGIVESVRVVARAAGVDGAGDDLAAELRTRLDEAAAPVRQVTARPVVVVVEWLDPPFAAGHWVPEQVALAGGTEALGRASAPSFRTTWDAVRAASPDVVVLAPCGFRADEVVERAAADGVLDALAGTPAARAGRVVAVDANAYLSRPGPRVADGVALLASVLHPGIAPPFADPVAAIPVSRPSSAAPATDRRSCGSR